MSVPVSLQCPSKMPLHAMRIYGISESALVIALFKSPEVVRHCPTHYRVSDQAYLSSGVVVVWADIRLLVV